MLKPLLDFFHECYANANSRSFQLFLLLSEPHMNDEQ